LVLVGLVSAGAIAFAAACAPAEPAVRAPDKEPPVALVSPPSKSMGADARTRLAEVIEGSPKSVAGERLNVELLRSFYARHRFAPVWETRQAQANSLLDAISRAGNHGLAPELFLHADLLKSPAALSALDRELLLSNAFLSYADALARGAVPVERRRDDETLVPEPIDVAVALDNAIASADAGAAIERLAPTTPTYRALRQALQDKTAPTRVREIKVNLERERWLPRRLPADRVWVNVADGRLVMYRDDHPVFSTRVIVGMTERRNQSPELQASIDGIWFNPPWNVPKDIAEGMLAKARNDPTYLARHNMTMLPDGVLQQRGGGTSALGQMMFHMQNRFDVYLHDTPSKNLFGRDDRRFSHGCIRVEDPKKLAALLMRQPMEAIDESIATGSANWRALPKAVPVFVVYETAFADGDGKVQFRADIYGRDAEIAQALDPKRRTVAERKAP
jgi:murein L,D-transpeptidase YcbB/YkuD